MTFTSATGAGWTCTGSLNCGYAFGSGVFNTSASLVPLVITATTKTPGIYENCGTVAASGLPETTYSNNRDCVKVEFKYPPNHIQVEKVNLDPSCTPELLCRFQIKVTNLDPWPFSGPVTIADNTTIAMNIAFTDVPCPTPPTAIPFSCVTSPLTIPASGTLTFTVNGVIPARLGPADRRSSRSQELRDTQPSAARDDHHHPARLQAVPGPLRLCLSHDAGSDR